MRLDFHDRANQSDTRIPTAGGTGSLAVAKEVNSVTRNKQTREVSPGLGPRVISVSAVSSPCWSKQLLCIVESYWLGLFSLLLPPLGVHVCNLRQKGKLLLTVFQKKLPVFILNVS